MNAENNFYIRAIEPSYHDLPEVLAPSIGKPTKKKIQEVLVGYKTEDRQLIGYLEEKKLIAVIGIELSPPNATILHLSVLPNYQSKGFAKQLVHHVMDHYIPEVLSAETDSEGVGFYRALGFKCTTFEGKHGKRYNCTISYQP
jgi:ribosomal protein S18 acetylase RimI-like enzyme